MNTHSLAIGPTPNSVQNEWQKTPNAWLIPEEGELEHVSNVLVSQGAAQGTGFCITCFRVLRPNTHSLDTQGLLQIKKKKKKKAKQLTAAPEAPKYSRQTPEGARDYKLL